MHYIGLDIGGTKIEGILIDKNFNVLKRVKKPTEAEKSRSTIVNNIAAAIKELDDGNVKGIGIGVPGFADKEGKVRLSPNITGFEGYNLRKALETKLKRPIHMENDAHCFILAEQKRGAVQGMKNVVGLTLGTGVGGGAIVDGALLKGKHGGAAHFGHMILDTSQVRDGRGDLEYWCGGKNFEKRYESLSKQKKTATEIFSSTDKAAKQLARDYHVKLGIAIADLIAAFDPEAVILGGSVSDVVNIPQLKKIVLQHGRESLVKETKILKNKLGGSAGVYGAAALAIN